MYNYYSLLKTLRFGVVFTLMQSWGKLLCAKPGPILIVPHFSQNYLAKLF